MAKQYLKNYTSADLEQYILDIMEKKRVVGK